MSTENITPAWTDPVLEIGIADHSAISGPLRHDGKSDGVISGEVEDAKAAAKSEPVQREPTSSLVLVKAMNAEKIGADPPSGAVPLASESESAESTPRSLWVVKGNAAERTGDFIGDRYELLGLLGRGGMGDVYDALFRISGQHVAIKILRRSLSLKLKSSWRFAREFKILDIIEHPNLVVVRDYGRLEDGSLFMVMEKLPGQSLDEIKGALPVMSVISIGKQLCAVMECLHKKGVIHRDLKPSNVILLDDTQDRIKLIDLGIARLGPRWRLGDRPNRTPPEERELTETGVIVGTRRYVPPEADRSEPTVLWDIYALGVLLWQLATGKPPPEHWRLDGAMHGEKEGQYGIPLILERLLRDAMSVDPKRRLATASEFFEELEVAEAESNPDDEPEMHDEHRDREGSRERRNSRRSRGEGSPAKGSLLENLLQKLSRSSRSAGRFGKAIAAVLFVLLGTALGVAGTLQAMTPEPEFARVDRELPMILSALQNRISGCVDNPAEDTFVDFRISFGRLLAVDPGSPEEAMIASCIADGLSDVYFAQTGVLSTQRVFLKTLAHARD